MLRARNNGYEPKEDDPCFLYICRSDWRMRNCEDAVTSNETDTPIIREKARLLFRERMITLELQAEHAAVKQAIARAASPPTLAKRMEKEIKTELRTHLDETGQVAFPPLSDDDSEDDTAGVVPSGIYDPVVLRLKP